MNNVLLDPLPEEWTDESGYVYKLDTDFQIGIQICLLRDDPDWSDLEKTWKIGELLFENEMPENPLEIGECIEWFMNGWSHDRHNKQKDAKRAEKLIDFDIDQWRIYSAFRAQYGIDLNAAQMHWWMFMGLLCNLEECAFTRVQDIRQKEINAKMSKEEKKALTEAKEVYALETVKSIEDKMLEAEQEERDRAALDEFNKIRKRN